MSAPSPLSFEEHRELSRELFNTQRRLRELRQMVVSVYGRESRTAFSFERVDETLDRLRFDLQVQVSADCPGIPTTGLYR
jgi:hypothetical protein